MGWRKKQPFKHGCVVVSSPSCRPLLCQPRAAGTGFEVRGPCTCTELPQFSDFEQPTWQGCLPTNIPKSHAKAPAHFPCAPEGNSASRPVKTWAAMVLSGQPPLHPACFCCIRQEGIRWRLHSPGSQHYVTLMLFFFPGFCYLQPRCLLPPGQVLSLQASPTFSITVRPWLEGMAGAGQVTPGGKQPHGLHRQEKPGGWSVLCLYIVALHHTPSARGVGEEGRVGKGTEKGPPLPPGSPLPQKECAQPWPPMVMQNRRSLCPIATEPWLASSLTQRSKMAAPRLSAFQCYMVASLSHRLWHHSGRPGFKSPDWGLCTGSCLLSQLPFLVCQLRMASSSHSAKGMFAPP